MMIQKVTGVPDKYASAFMKMEFMNAFHKNGHGTLLYCI